MRHPRIVFKALWIALIFGIIFAGIFATEAYMRSLGASMTDGLQKETYLSQRNVFICFSLCALTMSVFQGFALFSLNKKQNA